MDQPNKSLSCPECGEPLAVNPAELELFSQIVCESCLAALEVVDEDPLELAVMDIDADEFDEDDDYDDLDDVDDEED